MVVHTPEYWKEERFQPLIEETTALGNKVLIPKKLQNAWEMWKKRKDEILRNIEQAKVAVWFRKSLRNPVYQDLKRVYFEQYHK